MYENRNTRSYLDSLSIHENFICDINCDLEYVLWEFNADSFSGRTCGKLMSFMNRTDMKCFDREMMSADAYTYISYGNSDIK